MPTDLGPRWNAHTYTGYPAHMSPEDYAIWQRYRPTLAPSATAFYFDVGLGDGRAPNPAPTPALAAGWTRLNQKRADALVVYPDGVDLIELRTRAGLNSIGRLIGYRLLYLTDPQAGPLRTTILVTDTNDPDLRRLTPAQHIAYVIV